MRLGVFGGTFSPPHLGHLAAARVFAGALCLDQLLIGPAAQAPLRDLPAQVSVQDRVALCRLTFP
ncbi:MAG: nicotinate-nucleotide adenylyltransferase, partial [Oscillospiraceae bacterium]|nr:nicotinate-nucleotide adenylyltransferase [Oscillospiraceae bacterium]